jgi:hypothetical protein
MNCSCCGKKLTRNRDMHHKMDVAIEHAVKLLLHKYTSTEIPEKIDITIAEVTQIAERTKHGNCLPLSKSEAIKALLLSKPDRSYRSIAAEVGVACSTVCDHARALGIVRKIRSVIPEKTKPRR